MRGAAKLCVPSSHLGKDLTCVNLNSAHEDTCWAVTQPKKMLAAHTGWSGLPGKIWKEKQGGRKSTFLMPRLQSFADTYIINKISVPGTRNGLVPHRRARSSLGDCAVIAIPLDGVGWLSGGLA